MYQQVKYNEKMTLYILGALGVCYMTDLIILSGFCNYKYGAKKFRELENQKLIASDFVSKRKFYFLTTKGYKAIGKQHSGYKVNNTTRHDLVVATIATWLYLTKNISYADLITDRQMKYILKGSNIHRPDIVLQNICYEFERSIKDKARLLNILKENQKYEKQVWIVDETFLKNRIKRMAEENLIRNVEVIMLDTVLEHVENADISSNNVRSKAILGKRNTKKVVERTSNNIMQKYRVLGDN